MLTIELPPGMEARLEALAMRTGRAKDDVVREAIAELLADVEDAEIVEKRLEESRARGEASIPLETLMRRHGKAD